MSAPRPQIEPINDLPEDETTSARLSKNRIFISRIKRKILKHVYLVRIAIILIILAILVFSGVTAINIIKKSQLGFYLKLAENFLFIPSGKISSIDGRTNILILGKGGKGHEAPDLTDTIIFASIKNDPSGKFVSMGSKSKISMVSLPRDIWITDLRTKLNSIYYWGNQKEPNGGGLTLSKSVVEEVVGLPVQYGVVVDFSGFKKIIDVLGGIKVNVQNSFTDKQFPIAGREKDLCGGDTTYACRYKTITFEKGLQYMDGETALNYVRSRHADGDEGTDLARAARQERVMEAIKNKVLTKEIYLHPKKLIELKDAILGSIETDITPEEAAVLVRLLLDGRENMNSMVLSQDLLENPPQSPKYDNLYVFIPKEIDPTDHSGRSWSKVQEWIKNELEKK
jgi:polyisoprenyl-teichoic acid--peptidoglycan teichoic acid transferase